MFKFELIIKKTEHTRRENIIMTYNQFNVLLYLTNHRNVNQREIAEGTDLSLGTVNSILKSLRKSGAVDDCTITKEGLERLEPYKVDNAIILAAGMATRFVPVW